MGFTPTAEIHRSVARIRGLLIAPDFDVGFRSLHPRLYAVACSAG